MSDRGRSSSPAHGTLASTTVRSGVAEKISFIKQHKLAENRPVYPSGGSVGYGLHGGSSSSGSPSAGNSTAAPAKWVQPSGPRRPGEGTENEEQGIVNAELQPGGASLHITLLAAGFIIGPSGSSVRDIMRQTGCDIKSWTEPAGPQSRRPSRTFVIEGDSAAVGHAVDIISAAVDRYKELCEGRCQGQSVLRLQRVMGVEFSYQPPPRNLVPFAASLKGHVGSRYPKPAEMDTSVFLHQHQQNADRNLASSAGPPGLMLPISAGYMIPPFMPPGLGYNELAAAYGSGGSFSGGTLPSDAAAALPYISLLPSSPMAYPGVTSGMAPLWFPPSPVHTPAPILGPPSQSILGSTFRAFPPSLGQDSFGGTFGTPGFQHGGPLQPVSPSRLNPLARPWGSDQDPQDQDSAKQLEAQRLGIDYASSFNMHPAGTTNLASHMLGPERVSDPGTTSAHLQQCYHEMPDFQHPSRGSISYPGSEIGWEGGIGSGGSLRDAYHTAGPQKHQQQQQQHQPQHQPHLLRAGKTPKRPTSLPQQGLGGPGGMADLQHVLLEASSGAATSASTPAKTNDNKAGSSGSVEEQGNIESPVLVSTADPLVSPTRFSSGSYMGMAAPPLRMRSQEVRPEDWTRQLQFQQALQDEAPTAAMDNLSITSSGSHA